MSRSQVTILLTGVGAPGTRGTIYALRGNEGGVKVRLVGTDMKSDPIGKIWVGAFHRVPPPEEDGYVDAVNGICEREGVEVILPQTTRETVVLSANRSRVTRPVAVSEGKAIRKANDKYELLKVYRKLGLPYPEFFLVTTPDQLWDRASRLGYPERPVVVKPPVSFGGRGFRVVREDSEWNARRFLTEKPGGAESTLGALAEVLGRGGGPGFPRLLVTEYLPGKEYSVDAFRGRKLSVAVPRSRDEIVNGISFRTKYEPRKNLVDFTLRASEYIGLRYAFGFQYKLDGSGVPKVLECNPRIQGTMVASFFAGVNVIWMAVREALGDYPDRASRRLRRSEFRRYWGGIGFRGGLPIGEI